MDLIIHRGTHQIGGCITEIGTKKARIFIDFGTGLQSEVSSSPLKIDGITTGQANCDGIFFTHYHGDHIGQYADILPGIPLYMGQAAKEIFTILQARLSMKNTELRRTIPLLENIFTFSPARPIHIKDIKITPFTVDHSAYDAYMFLIESESKKILHTGDFRMHGFRGKGVIPMLKKYVGKIDLLITEGTTLSRSDTQTVSEQELTAKAKEYMKNYKYVFILCSSTNIDRIAAVHAATPQRKYFICDNYQQDILHVVEKYAAGRSALYSFSKALTYGDNLLPKLRAKGFCMLVRANNRFSEIMSQFDKKNCLILYSMWKGYLQNEKMGISKFTEGYLWESLHTSGHASKSALCEVCQTVSPKIGIVPIHSDTPQNMDTLHLPYKLIDLQDQQVFQL